MKSLFRNFDRSGVEYLLISGQASVLYGGATFSEDVDLWVRPTPANLTRARTALSRAGATWYKLTPPLTPGLMKKGHGFHFLLPDAAGPAYLDVLGAPPRVGSFAASRKTARRMPSEWGVLPVVSIEDLVEMKKTRRLSDYEVISNLARVRLSESPSDASVMRWAARNTFRAEDRVRIARELGKRLSLEACRRRISREIAILQSRDVRYWRPLIAELRVLRRSGRLMPDGERVRR
ncbi:MAG: hypothetical protein HYY18_07315 [Planctomycetes bacterium]|nr:hypothetical protein [Planctomycetota bacterium]